MQVHVQVRRVPAMPHHVGVWVDDQPGEYQILMQEDLISEEGARLLGDVLTRSAEGWERKSSEEDDDDED